MSDFELDDPEESTGLIEKLPYGGDQVNRLNQREEDPDETERVKRRKKGV